MDATDRMGYRSDAPAMYFLGRGARKNQNLVWVVDDDVYRPLFSRLMPYLPQGERQEPLGLNPRFRFYKYAEGDYFRMHRDGSWPGSAYVRVTNPRGKQTTQLEWDAYGDRWSQMSLLLFLNDDYTGGEMQFEPGSDQLVAAPETDSDSDTDEDGVEAVNGAEVIEAPDDSEAGMDTSIYTVRPPAGSVLCYYHGDHPWSVKHGSATVESGTKYVLRTDVLYSTLGSAADRARPDTWARPYSTRRAKQVLDLKRGRRMQVTKRDRLCNYDNWHGKTLGS